jgi:hypothetical protein
LPLSLGLPVILLAFELERIVAKVDLNFIKQAVFEPSQPECRQRLAAKSFCQPSENRTPFERGVMSEKRCDSKQKAHRRKRRWARFEEKSG